MRGRLLVIAVLCSAALGVGSAQPSQPETTTVARQASSPSYRVEVWGGVSRGSTSWGILGAVPDVRMALGAVRFSRELLRAPDTVHSRSWWYTADLVPKARFSPPWTSGSAGQCPAGHVCAVPQPGSDASFFPKGSVDGWGFSPVGLTYAIQAAQRIQVTVGGSGGFMWTTRPIPTTRAGKFNFTGLAEGGIRFLPHDDWELALSYRFHHLSNAGTASENPAIASHLLSASLGWHRSAARFP